MIPKSDGGGHKVKDEEVYDDDTSLDDEDEEKEYDYDDDE